MGESCSTARCSSALLLPRDAHTGCSLPVWQAGKGGSSSFPLQSKEWFSPPSQVIASSALCVYNTVFRLGLVHSRTCRLSSSRGLSLLQQAAGERSYSRCSGAKRQILPLERQTTEQSKGFLARPTQAQTPLLR